MHPPDCTVRTATCCCTEWGWRYRWLSHWTSGHSESGGIKVKLAGGFRDIVQRFQSVAVVCVRHDWESLPCPTPLVMVSKSITSSWPLHCFHFLPQLPRWDLYTFTLGVLLCVRVHAFTSLCDWESAPMWNVFCTCSELFPLVLQSIYFLMHNKIGS